MSLSVQCEAVRQPQSASCTESWSRCLRVGGWQPSVRVFCCLLVQRLCTTVHRLDQPSRRAGCSPAVVQPADLFLADRGWPNIKDLSLRMSRPPSMAARQAAELNGTVVSASDVPRVPLPSLEELESIRCDTAAHSMKRQAGHPRSPCPTTCVGCSPPHARVLANEQQDDASWPGAVAWRSKLRLAPFVPVCQGSRQLLRQA